MFSVLKNLFERISKLFSLGITSLSEAAQTITPFVDKKMKERITNLEMLYGIMRGQWLIFILALGIIALCALLCIVWNKDDMACTIWWGSIFVFYGLWLPKVFRSVLEEQKAQNGDITPSNGDSIDSSTNLSNDDIIDSSGDSGDNSSNSENAQDDTVLD